MLWHRLKRWFRFLFQRRERGWDDSETWNLSGTIAKFALPRLKRFKEVNNGCPGGMNEKDWDSMLDDMIYALKVCVRETEEFLGPNDVDWTRVEKGLSAFGSRFRDLWW